MRARPTLRRSALVLTAWAVVLGPAAAPAGPPRVPEEVRVQAPAHCLTRLEAEIAEGINAYRVANGLGPVPLSRCLTEVAKTHLDDLERSNPQASTDARGMPCSLHSWSARGPWSSVCYTRDHAQAGEMWNKPRQLTGGLYPGQGVEVAHWRTTPVTAADTLEAWKRSPAHNSVLLERGQWQGARWPAMGVGAGGNYAVVWFGDRDDPLGPVCQCEEEREPFLKSLVPAASPSPR
ncbi:MAG: CAP domain-containing protein [Deferrisomatales bacterium]